MSATTRHNADPSKPDAGRTQGTHRVDRHPAQQESHVGEVHTPRRDDTAHEPGHPRT